MIPSWENMTEQHLNPYGETWQPDEDWRTDYVTSPRNTSASDAPVQVAGLLNGNGWTAAFKHAALAGALGAAGGLLIGPVGAVMGIAAGLVMSTSALQSQARHTGKVGSQRVAVRPNSREVEEQRARQRAERALEKQEREQEWAQRQQEEWAQFLSEKTSVAKSVLQQYDMHVGNVAAVGRNKAIIEIPWHIAWPIRRQLIDVLESHLQMHTVFISVRFCDKCGTKLAGPVAEVQMCPACKRSFLDTGTARSNRCVPPEQRERQRTPIRPEMTRTLPVSEKTQLTRKTGPDKPVAITKRDATLLTKEDENKKGRIEDVNACAEHQTWDPLEVDDYQEDVDLTPLMKRLSEKPTLATAPLRTMSVCKAEASKSEPSKYATPQDATHKAVDAIVASEQRTSAQTTMTLSTQHSTQTTVSKGDIVVGRRVQCLGRYKDLTGVIQLVDKKKRAVKVLLDKFGVSVSIAIALVATLEEVPAQ